jgi:hypothetical protein
MTRTTELLKKIETIITKGGCLNCRFSFGRWALCQYCRHKIELYKSELKGRLDALKEELSFWEKSGFTEMLLGFPLIKERIASIQEEIKLIEGAI